MIPFFPFFQLPSLRLASFTIQVFGLFAAVDTYVGARRAASAQCREYAATGSTDKGRVR